MLWHLQSYTYLFYVLCPKLALIGKKNWHQYVWKLAPIYLQFAPIYSKIGSNIFSIYAFFHLCHTNLQVMTPGVEDRVQTLSLGLEAPPFEGVFWYSSLTIKYKSLNSNFEEDENVLPILGCWKVVSVYHLAIKTITLLLPSFKPLQNFCDQQPTAMCPKFC